MKSKIAYFKLAPRQPNVNGIYYEQESYDKAMTKFLNNDKPPVYLGYDSNDAIGFVRNIKNNVGIIELLNHEIANNIFNDKSNKVIGFSLSGQMINNEDRKMFKIDSIDSAHVINKKDIEGSEYYNE